MHIDWMRWVTVALFFVFLPWYRKLLTWMLAPVSRFVDRHMSDGRVKRVLLRRWD